jgi:hypothetical protein
MLIGKNPNKKFNVKKNNFLKNKNFYFHTLGARSIWERTLDVDYRNIAIWLKYAEMEMRK